MVRRCGRDWERMWCGEVDLLPPIRFQSCNLVAELVVTWGRPISGVSIEF